MRSNQQNKRSRGRNNNNRKNSNPLTRNYESNGPDIRVRGNAAHVAEKYVQLARDANSSGDSVAAENYLQHAEHYFRIISAAQAQQQAQQQVQQQAQAARAESQENRPDRGQQNRPADRPESKSPGSEKSGAVEKENSQETGKKTGETNSGEPVIGEVVSLENEKRSPRARRAQRRPIAEKPLEKATKTAPDPIQVKTGADSNKDPAEAPQPSVGELPAFVTTEADNSAAE